MLVFGVQAVQLFYHQGRYRAFKPTGAGELAYGWLRDAMEWYEKAEARRPAGNEKAILRWNTCARILGRREVKSRVEDSMPLASE